MGLVSHSEIWMRGPVCSGEWLHLCRFGAVRVAQQEDSEEGREATLTGCVSGVWGVRLSGRGALGGGRGQKFDEVSMKLWVIWKRTVKPCQAISRYT